MSFGAELRRRRLASGYTLGRFAQKLNYSKSHLSKIETGAKAPSPDLARRCDAALKANGDLSALVPERQRIRRPNERVVNTHPLSIDSDSHWWIRLDKDGGGEFSTAQRRDGPPPTVLETLTWAMPPADRLRGPGTDDFERYRSMFDEIRQMGQTTTPAMLLPILILQTRMLSGIAAYAQSPVREQLLGLASRYAELTGWMAQEAGAHERALSWTNLAVELAAELGDHDLAAYALVRRADIAMYDRNARDTVALAQLAQASSRTARVRGLAAQREAQGHALAGDHDACLAALDRAARWFDRPLDEGPLPPLGSTTIENPVEMAAGWCLYDLGLPQQAADRLRTQLDRTPITAQRMRARLGARLALSLVAAGELEEGCDEAHAALDSFGRAHSATVSTDLRRLGYELNRWPTHPSVRDVMPRLAEALAP
ncbi:helix-turn-helix domain-containing protein [Phytohabitans kaempferiae]|uniref:Helix-turn-helix domain-containing protein n=1 Tax=Phytohabitans kaempferiae TaxID=1620943 RepID=A0ABV6ME76_9ACTN